MTFCAIPNHQFKTNFYCQHTISKHNEKIEGLLKLLDENIIISSQNEIFKAEKIVFHEELVENITEKNDSEKSVDNHDLQQSSFASGNGRVGFVH